MPSLPQKKVKKTYTLSCQWLIKKAGGVRWRGRPIPRNVQQPLLHWKPNPGPSMSTAWSCWPEPRPPGNHEARVPPMLGLWDRTMSFSPCPRTAQLLWSYHLLREAFVLSLRITAPSLPHKCIDIYIYISIFAHIHVYVCAYIYIYICIYKFGPGVYSGSQPLSANKIK